MKDLILKTVNVIHILLMEFSKILIVAMVPCLRECIPAVCLRQRDFVVRGSRPHALRVVHLHFNGAGRQTKAEYNDQPPGAEHDARLVEFCP